MAVKKMFSGFGLSACFPIAAGRSDSFQLQPAETAGEQEIKIA